MQRPPLTHSHLLLSNMIRNCDASQVQFALSANFSAARSARYMRSEANTATPWLHISKSMVAGRERERERERGRERERERRKEGERA